MALAMSNATSLATAAPSAVSLSMVNQSPSSSSSTVRFTNGAAIYNRGMGASGRRSTLAVVRAEEARSRSADAAAPPPPPSSTPPGMSATEAPLGVITSSAPLAQGQEKPVGERIAYICQDCGYVYDGQTPFEDVPEDYNCPQCKAPKMRFTMANATTDEVLDTTKSDDTSRGSGVKSGSASSNN